MKSNQDISRRDFLKSAGATVVVLNLESLLSGCLSLGLGFTEKERAVYPPLSQSKVQPSPEGCFVGTMFFDYFPGSYKHKEYPGGKAPKIAMFNNPVGSLHHFPHTMVSAALEDNLIPVVSWSSYSLVHQYSLKGIAEGKADDHIVDFAKGAVQIKKPYFVRTFIEMTLPSEGHWIWSGQPQCRDRGRP